MKKIALSNGGMALVDDEDFDGLSRFRWYRWAGYARRTSDKELMHRLIHHAPKGKVVDHINQDKLDNRRINLRSASKSLNSLNRGINKNNTHGFRGVSYMPGRSKPWVSRIKVNGRVRYFGYYSTKEAAGNAVMDGLQGLLDNDANVPQNERA